MRRLPSSSTSNSSVAAAGAGRFEGGEGEKVIAGTWRREVVRRRRHSAKNSSERRRQDRQPAPHAHDSPDADSCGTERACPPFGGITPPAPRLQPREPGPAHVSRQSRHAVAIRSCMRCAPRVARRSPLGMGPLLAVTASMHGQAPLAVSAPLAGPPPPTHTHRPSPWAAHLPGSRCRSTAHHRRSGQRRPPA